MPLRKNFGALRHDWSAPVVTWISHKHRLGSSFPAEGGCRDPDIELLLRVRDGDDAAFEVLVEKFRRPLVGFLFRMVHDQVIAEQLAQETLLRVFHSRHGYAANAGFSTCLYRIAAGLALNHVGDIRPEGMKAATGIEQCEEETKMTVDLPDRALKAEQTVKRERMEVIRGQIDALPDGQRIAVLLHRYQGLDYGQIADVLGLSESATKSLLFRAYETLREKLEQLI